MERRYLADMRKEQHQNTRTYLASVLAVSSGTRETCLPLQHIVWVHGRCALTCVMQAEQVHNSTKRARTTPQKITLSLRSAHRGVK